MVFCIHVLVVVQKHRMDLLRNKRSSFFLSPTSRSIRSSINAIQTNSIFSLEYNEMCKRAGHLLMLKEAQ